MLFISYLIFYFFSILLVILQFYFLKVGQEKREIFKQELSHEILEKTLLSVEDYLHRKKII